MAVVFVIATLAHRRTRLRGAQGVEI
jgi:hypothetical protein